MDEQPHPHHHQPTDGGMPPGPAQSVPPAYGHEPAQHAQPWAPPHEPMPVAQPMSAPIEIPQLQSGQSPRPVPVVQVLSPVGVEYVFMIISLVTAAIGLTAALLAMVNGKFDFTVLAFPAALLVTGVPVFAFLFLRLKKLELRNPALKLDPSKRRTTQATQIISFIVSMFTVVGLIFAILAKLGGQSDVSIGKAILDALCVLVVAGGILAYYWHDEHKG